jgi:hypothetical protein
MKAKHNVWKNKLVKTMFFTTVILVAALFLGSAASAGLTPSKTTTQNKNKDMLTLANKAPQAGLSSASYQQIQPATKRYTPMVPFGDVIFSQTYYTPDESWNFVTSSVGLGYLVQEDFWDLSDAIGDVEWYGLSLIWNSGWTAGDPTGTTFNIIFYEDNGGVPGAQVASFSVEPTVVDTGLLYGGVYPMWYWTVVLDSSVDLTTGWMAIQSDVSPNNCNFLWAAGPEGNFNALQNGGATGANMAFSLTAPDIQLDHDIAVQSIVAPVSGNAAPSIPTVKVKNAGLNTEYNVDIQMEISKIVISDNGPCITPVEETLGFGPQAANELVPAVQNARMNIQHFRTMTGLSPLEPL